MRQGLLFINELIYGQYTLIEDKENQVILEGIYNRAAEQFVNEFTKQSPGFPRVLKCFDMEILFPDENNMLTVERDQAVFGSSILFKECIINWPLVEAPFIISDDELQIIRIPVIFRERLGDSKCLQLATD